MLIQSFVTALAACAFFPDGVMGIKPKMGNTARRNQQRAAKIVQEAQAGNHLHARQTNGTSGTNTTTPKRFLTNATARKC